MQDADADFRRTGKKMGDLIEIKKVDVDQHMDLAEKIWDPCCAHLNY